MSTKVFSPQIEATQSRPFSAEIKNVFGISPLNYAVQSTEEYETVTQEDEFVYSEEWERNTFACSGTLLNRKRRKIGELGERGVKSGRKRRSRRKGRKRRRED